LLQLWREEYVHPEHRMCSLCGNTGRVDTRGRVFTRTGKDCGQEHFCICPNGRAFKKVDDRQRREGKP
jgi:hypothetical protein